METHPKIKTLFNEADRSTQSARYAEHPVALAYLNQIVERHDPDMFSWIELNEADRLRAMFGTLPIEKTVFALAETEAEEVISGDNAHAFKRRYDFQNATRNFVERLAVPRALDESAIVPIPTCEPWLRYTYKGVTVDFEAVPQAINVWEIDSKNPRCGEAREALLNLQAQYGIVLLRAVIEDSPEASAFAQRMLDEGVVYRADYWSGIELKSSPINPPAVAEAAPARATPARTAASSSPALDI